MGGVGTLCAIAHYRAALSWNLQSDMPRIGQLETNGDRLSFVATFYIIELT